MNSDAPEVRDHYERWPFPGCDFAGKDGLLILKSLQESLDAFSAAGGLSDGPLRVLDAGCGTGHTTVALARRFPELTFLGVDFSDSSIRVARRAACHLTNVSFERADITNDLARLGQFSMVLSFGVLHHTRDIEASLRCIVRQIAPGGRLLLWLYGRHGRARHCLNQAFIRLLCGDGPAPERISIAREFLKHLGQGHATGSGFYTPHGSGEEGVSWLLEHLEWLADQMIPAHEQDVTLDELLDLFARCGLGRFEWLGVSTELGNYTSSAALVERFDALSRRERLLAIDCLIKPEHYLVAGEKR